MYFTTYTIPQEEKHHSIKSTYKKFALRGLADPRQSPATVVLAELARGRHLEVRAALTGPGVPHPGPGVGAVVRVVAGGAVHGDGVGEGHGDSTAAF